MMQCACMVSLHRCVGTILSEAQLVNQTGAQTVAFAFLVNLTFLEADKRLKDITETIISIVNY